MQNPKVDLRPPRAANPLHIMWVLWAILATALLAISAWGFALHYPVHPMRHVAGFFESESQSLAAVIPAGVKVSEVLVTDGDAVTEGQVLARFDQLALHETAHKLRLDLTLNNALQSCWRNSVSMAATAGTSTDTQAVPKIEACQNQLRQDTLSRAQLLHRRNNLNRETALAVQELLSRAQKTEAPVDRILKLRAAIEREALHGIIGDIELELALLAHRQEADRLEKLIALEDAAKNLATQLSDIEALIAAPWLYAPKSGQIERVRVPQTTAPIPQEEVLAFISLPSDAPKTATFSLPQTEAAQLSEGDILHVTFAGVPLSIPPSQARVTHVSQDRTNLDAASVALHFDQATPLPEALSQLPKGTRSNLSVRMPQTRLAPILQAAGQRLLASF